MPIYHKGPTSSMVGSHNMADIDYHTSEAAKVKRTREQAYFNSYDFDAIEVLPYDDDDDDEDGNKVKGTEVRGKKSKGKMPGKSTSSQKHLKSKSHSKQIQQTARQQNLTGLTPATKHQARNQQSQQQQQHLGKSLLNPSAKQKTPTITTKANGSHPNTININNETFIVDNLQQHSKHDESNNSNNNNNTSSSSNTRKHHSYLQRFGVAIFGGTSNSNNKTVTQSSATIQAIPPPPPPHQHHHQSLSTTSSTSSSSSASSTSTLTATSTANSSATLSHTLRNEDIKHLKVMPSISSNSHNAARIAPSSASASTLSSSSASSTASISSSIMVNADSHGSHRHSSDDGNHGGAATAIGSLSSPITNSTNPATAAASPASDGGNFLLPRVMLKYQSTPSNSNINSNSSCSTNNNNNSNNNNHLATTPSQNSMSLASAITTKHNATTTTSTSSTTANISNGATNKVALAIRAATDELPNLKANKILMQNTALKKHSTASSSLSSLASDEIVEIHCQDKKKNATGHMEGTKVLPVKGKAKPPGRAGSHQSHYSTDKSASSGYYSSNVCSTYSLEEHIYSEPTLDVKKEKTLGSSQHNHKESARVIEKAAVGNGGGGGGGAAAIKKPVEESGKLKSNSSSNMHSHNNNNNQQATLSMGQTATAISVMRTLDYNRRYRFTDPAPVTTDEKTASTLTALPPTPANDQDFKEKLRILESSIENLDRHLKAFPGLASTDAIVAYVQNPAYISSGNNSNNHDKSRVYSHLPTIKEAFDGGGGGGSAKPQWNEDPVTDDSLLDIDLDSFLLDERKKTTKSSENTNNHRKAGGIDNPSFLIGEQEENHYKCAKYINSCPEDAYRVESDIIAPTRSSISEQSVAVSVDLYPKRYEDQLHFQNTRELLEDVRDKIRMLTRSGSQEPPDMQLTKVADTKQGASVNESIPKELNSMISTLRRELELYLERMNQHSELEIRQLCTGLVNNQKIVKMKNAFERRRSLTDSNEQLAAGASSSTYEAIHGSEMRALGNGPISIHQHITTIKCSSDPNFKMKRKSLTEVFPLSECYIEMAKTTTPSAALQPTMAQKSSMLLPQHAVNTQLQRNLNFHQPQIEHFEKSKFDKAKDNVESTQSGTGSGSASGGETSETNDKDSILDWHRKKPSIWEMYYGTNRLQQSLLGANTSNKKNNPMVPATTPSPMCYPSSRPESDFTLDLPRAEQLRIKMEKEKKFRQRCRVITSFLSLIFFLLTVMVVSLVLTRGKRMFGSMI